jgi:hypothetical protein
MEHFDKFAKFGSKPPKQPFFYRLCIVHARPATDLKSTHEVEAATPKALLVRDRI